MNKLVTIVISPRDRYSELAHCIAQVYANTDIDLFDLIILDLGYPSKDMHQATSELKSQSNFEIINLGHIIPIEAIDKIAKRIRTKYTVFLDNDSRVLQGWLPPLIETIESRRAAVVYPVILEREGVDEGAAIRNHLFTTEFRVVYVDENPYLIEHKTYRRALVDAIPKDVTESQAFELHCVMFDTEVLQSLEMPRMTIREHLDIGLQLRAKGLKIYVDPRSQIVFDNLGTRANWSDLRYFNLRWNSQITSRSSRLFEKRWGYKFYSEESTYNWAARRRLFLILKWLYLPTSVANKIDRLISAIRRRIIPVWDPLKDPISQSILLYEKLDNRAPEQLDHSVL